MEDRTMVVKGLVGASRCVILFISYRRLISFCFVRWRNYIRRLGNEYR